jgi:hypothetical protein
MIVSRFCFLVALAARPVLVILRQTFVFRRQNGAAWAGQSLRGEGDRLNGLAWQSAFLTKSSRGSLWTQTPPLPKGGPAQTLQRHGRELRTMLVTSNVVQISHRATTAIKAARSAAQARSVRR